MARFKDFGTPFDAETAEPLTFKLYNEDFDCYPEMQGKSLLEFASLSGDEDPAVAAKAVVSFFEKVLLPESFERFEALTVDPNRIVSMNTLADIVSWVMEQYTNRPTQGSEH